MTESILTQLSLEIGYKASIDEEGKDVFKKQNFISIKESSSDEAICIVGNAIGKVLNTEIYRVSKEVKYELIEF